MAFQNAYALDERTKGIADMLLTAYQTQGGTSLHSDELSSLLRKTQGSSTAASILWKRGADLFNKQDYANAQKYFQRIMLSYPNDEFASQAYFYNAECYFFPRNIEQSASAHKSFSISYPNNKMISQAQFRVGVSYFNKRDCPTAPAACHGFLNKFPPHELTP